LGLSNPVTWLAILGGVALLAAWVIVEKRIEHPLIDVALLTKGGIGLPIIIAFLFGAQLFGGQTASSVYVLSDPDVVGFGLGFTAATVGIVSLAAALSAFIASVLGDRVASRIGPKGAIVLGGLLVAGSYIAFLSAPTSVAVIVGAMIVGGLGNGLLISVLPTIVVRRAPADSVGIASALYNTSRTAAGAVAGAVFALIMGSFLMTVGSGESAVTTTSFAGYVAVWGTCTAIGLAIAALALFLRVPAAGTEEPHPVPATTADPVLEGESV
jgi:MFS family permease